MEDRFRSRSETATIRKLQPQLLVLPTAPERHILCEIVESQRGRTECSPRRIGAVRRLSFCVAVWLSRCTGYTVDVALAEASEVVISGISGEPRLDGGCKWAGRVRQERRFFAFAGSLRRFLPTAAEPSGCISSSASSVVWTVERGQPNSVSAGSVWRKGKASLTNRFRRSRKVEAQRDPDGAESGGTQRVSLRVNQVTDVREGRKLTQHRHREELALGRTPSLLPLPVLYYCAGSSSASRLVATGRGTRCTPSRGRAGTARPGRARSTRATRPLGSRRARP